MWGQLIGYLQRTRPQCYFIVHQPENVVTINTRLSGEGGRTSLLHSHLSVNETCPNADDALLDR